MLTTFFGNYEYWELRDKITVDPVNRLLIVNPNISNLDIKSDVYSAWKRWAKIENNIGDAPPAMRVIGGDPTVAGQTAGDIYFMINNWRLQIDIVTTAVTGVLFSDDFDTAYVNSELLAVYPAQVSSLVSGVDVSGGTANVDNDSIAQAVWAYLNRTLTGLPEPQATQITQIHSSLRLDENPNYKIDGLVWDSLMVNHQVSNSFGEQLGNLNVTVDEQGVARAVWEYII